jgi:cob(I)alamin adenosyltransferase
MSFKIYTKTGDKGTTGLFGGERVYKDNSRLDAYGTIDELNSFLGLALAFNEDETISKILLKLQYLLFDLGGDLATPLENRKVKIKRISYEDTLYLEKIIDQLVSELPELKVFILPGGSKTASYLHVARTVCRRAERRIIRASQEQKLNPEISILINRLSDLLFVLARYSNFVQNIKDIVWQK